MNSKLTPGNYFIELAFRRPVSQETLMRALVAMGFSSIEFDKNDDAAVGALSLASSFTRIPLSGSTATKVSTATLAPATSGLTRVAAPVSTPFSAPASAVLAPTPSRLSAPTFPTGSSAPSASPQLLATPTLGPIQTNSIPQYSSRVAPSQLLNTPTLGPIQTGTALQYNEPAPALLATPTKPGTPTGGGSASPASTSPITTTPDPEATAANSADTSYGLGSPNLTTGLTGGPAYQGGGGGGGDQSPGPNDGAGQPVTDSSPGPQAQDYTQPGPQAQDYAQPAQQNYAQPGPQDGQAANTSDPQDTLILPAGGDEAALLAQLSTDMTNAVASAVPAPERWHRWVEWGSPFATSPTHLTAVSGEEETTITRYRFVATLSKSFSASNAEDISWVFIRRLAINPFADLSFQLKPFKLTRDGFYEFRFFSRMKANPTKDSVKDTLTKMGFAPLKLNLLKKNMRIPHRGTVTVSMWLGIGRWSAPNSVVTEEDPFFFETCREVQP